jgi:hypothetical protein
MAFQRKQTQATRTAPTVTPSQAIELIQRQIAAGNVLLQGSIEKAPYESWKNTTVSYLDKAFGRGALNTTKLPGMACTGPFRGIPHTGGGVAQNPPRPAYTTNRLHRSSAD